jgi:hypothetical protein
MFARRQSVFASDDDLSATATNSTAGDTSDIDSELSDAPEMSEEAVEAANAASAAARPLTFASLRSQRQEQLRLQAQKEKSSPIVPASATIHPCVLCDVTTTEEKAILEHLLKEHKLVIADADGMSCLDR